LLCHKCVEVFAFLLQHVKESTDEMFQQHQPAGREKGGRVLAMYNPTGRLVGLVLIGSPCAGRPRSALYTVGLLLLCLLRTLTQLLSPGTTPADEPRKAWKGKKGPQTRTCC
jgi:hypothetical protein